jgi:methylenetetrahydrofolate dehydrogenase (NADP+) / methenyltetrahydrofolate cyclohydrolase / formyltetrahydrofolate synthetase
MAAAKIDGTAIAKKIREGLATEILERQKSNPRFRPSLRIIQGEHSSPI